MDNKSQRQEFLEMSSTTPLPSIRRRDFLVGLAATGAASAIGLNSLASAATKATAFSTENAVSLDRLTVDDFSRHLGETFQLQTDNDCTVSVKLIASQLECGKGACRPTTRNPFSVTFSLTGAPHLEQKTYRLSHRDLGVMELFFVPAKTPTGTTHLHAIFG